MSSSLSDIGKMPTLCFQKSLDLGYFSNMAQLLSSTDICKYSVVDTEKELISGKGQCLENGLILATGSSVSYWWLKDCSRMLNFEIMQLPYFINFVLIALR